ncbi:response regulator transcription factor [Luxibacter massiliensis]|uniref:response regulator transcription factor n=1 Tax=Luxibacter massiliensis TaxID=2219695 RepID=UPI0013DEFBC4|nr:response regulator [Luxibacter massiliensis]
MQTTLLIADDEYFIRQRLKRIIPWTELNLQLAGEAENGVEVLNMMNEQRVDIVLLDIRMPKMLGTETALHIRHNFPSTQVIILSGYNEFEYARSALQNGVSDYLLKPVDPSALLAALEKCVEKISISKNADAKLKSYDRHMCCNALTDVRDERLCMAEFYIQYPDFLQYKYSAYIGVYTMEDTPAGALGLSDRIHRCLGLRCEHFQESGHIYVIQLFFSTGMDISHLGSLLTEYVANAQSYMFLTANHVFSLEENWGVYYRRILSSLNQRYFHPYSELFMEFRHKEQGNEKIDLAKLRQTVMEYLNLGDVRNFRNFIQESFDTIVQKKNIDILFSFLNELFITFQIHYKVPANLDCSISDFISAMLEEEYTCDRLKEAVIHYGSQCISLKKIQPSDVTYCKKIMAYIDEHYSNPDLTVSSIARYFQMNASYLGAVFKNVRDQSILQYITRVRMDAAKKLLITREYLVSEVAAAVGYSDVFYFSKLFKKNFGCPPKEFIRIYEAEKEAGGPPAS